MGIIENREYPKLLSFSQLKLESPVTSVAFNFIDRAIAKQFTLTFRYFYTISGYSSLFYPLRTKSICDGI